MNFRTRLGFLQLETRENPSGPAVVPPVSTGTAPAPIGPATTGPVSAGATANATGGGANSNGGASITSSGSVTVQATQIATSVLNGIMTTANNNTNLGNNSVTGQPLLESTLTP